MNKLFDWKSIIFGIIAIIFFLLAITNAFAFIPLQSEYNITTNVNFPQLQELKFKNNFTSTIFNISCIGSSEFNYGNIPELFPLEQGALNVTITTHDSYSRTSKPQSCYFLTAQNVLRNIKTVLINLNDAGFVNTTININQDDNLILNNTAGYSRTITQLEQGSWSSTIAGNNQVTFNTNIITVAPIRLQDSYSSNILYVTVQNRTQLDYIHDASKDRVINFNIESIRNATLLLLEIYTDNFTVDYGQKKRGTGKITNIGDFPAINVTLSSSPWITFETNSFSLSPDAEQIFLFDVQATGINTSDATNKSYSFTISANGLNTEIENHSVSVFLNYKADLNLLIVNGTLVCPNPAFMTKQNCVNEQDGTEFKTFCYDMSLQILNSSGKMSELTKDYVKIERLGLTMNWTADEAQTVKDAIPMYGKIWNAITENNFVFGQMNASIMNYLINQSIENEGLRMTVTEQNSRIADMRTLISALVIMFILVLGALLFLYYDKKVANWFKNKMKERQGEESND